MKSFAPGVIRKVKCYLFILNKHLYLFSNRKETTRYALSKLSSWHSASVLRETRSNKVTLTEKVNQVEILFVILIPGISLVIFCHKIIIKKISFVLGPSREIEPIESVCVCVYIYLHMCVYICIYTYTFLCIYLYAYSILLQIH